jgi:hypothetical protein
MGETQDYDKSAIPVVHAPSHEAGGSDEIDVAGLSGVLTDEQLSSWAGVSGKPGTFPPVAHATDHENGGSDEVDVAGLSGVLADEQFSSWAGVSGKPGTFPPDPHHGTHEAGGSDVVAGLEDMYIKRNKQTIDIDYTLLSGFNGVVVGPITVADGKTITISDGSTLLVL